MEQWARVTFRVPEKQMEVDLEIPLFISASELVGALNEVYQLGIDVSDPKECYLKAEYPIALLKGSRKLWEFGVCNGTSVIWGNRGEQ